MSFLLFTKRFFAFFLSVLLVLLALATLAVLGFGIYALGIDATVDEQLLAPMGDRTTRLYCYGADGEETELSADRISGMENTLYCPLEDISPELIQAFISIEDKRFFEHGGIDWVRTASALLDYFRGGGAHFGGSTITQQLIKNLTGDNERSVRRKIAELRRAAALEKMLSKEEILERYLNVVNLAQGCYGVRTASNAYFSKEPGELTLSEAASIAAITNNPARYDPIRNPKDNRARRDIILCEMHAQGRISAEVLEATASLPITLCVSERALSARINSWYADLVISDVIADLVRERNMSESGASMLVYCGGLRIYTAMNEPLQQIVSEYYENEENFPTHADGKHAQSALLLVDPRNGDILALAGAIGEKRSNRIQSFATDTRRPSGSVIKPLSVYAPALARGLITQATVFDDIPLKYRANGAPWPHNSPNVYHGLTTVREAVCQSLNTVSVSVFERLGARNSYLFLRDALGFSSLDANADIGAAALALGQQHTGVTLREIVGGYTALADGGVYHAPRSYYRVLDRNGEVLLENGGQERRVLEEADAAILTMMLRDVVERGTGKAVTLKEHMEVAGKTGTTGKNCDKWFLGYTKELLCGVWYGFEYPAPLNDVHGNPALAIFDAVMQRIEQQHPARERSFALPENVVAVRYCRDSGALPCEACLLDARGERTAIGYFKRGTEPTAVCERHVCVQYCEGGGVACEDCPRACCRRVALLRHYREFPRQITVLDAPYTFVKDPLETGRNLSPNEPYYAVMDNSKHFYGVAMGEVPFNRSCPGHTNDGFWNRRLTFN